MISGLRGRHRHRARDLLDRGHSIDQVAEAVGLDTDEVEDIYIATIS